MSEDREVRARGLSTALRPISVGVGPTNGGKGDQRHSSYDYREFPTCGNRVLAAVQNRAGSTRVVELDGRRGTACYRAPK